MAGLLFGTGGVPHSSAEDSTVAGIARIAELGLGCLEIEFVQGVHMSKETALKVAEAAKKMKVKLTAHAPYFINLNSAEVDKVKASQYRIIQTARIAALCGAESIVFHAAFYGGNKAELVYNVGKEKLAEVIKRLGAENNRVCSRP